MITEEEENIVRQNIVRKVLKIAFETRNDCTVFDRVRRFKLLKQETTAQSLTE